MLKILGVNLTVKELTLVLVFTIVETITLVYWLIFAATSAALKVDSAQATTAIVILFVGLLVEHVIAFVAGKS